ncbi:MAG TPA: TetR/AcrR family transcriptional regulator [Solirubrobacteraceae bacterium]|nr:TetR/AcrR family transcriptional regulator [Solirubrobacteraceae bacterium]
MPDPAPPVPRGRHAPPLEVRLERQRARLFAAAAAVFARVGYAEASAEAISREAGMSKATFYEHFSNKEECIVTLFDAAAEQTRAAVVAGISTGDSPQERIRAGIHAFIGALVAYPDHARTLLVEIIGAGPRANARRDSVLETFAELLMAEGALAHEQYGAPQFASFDDAFALVGAIMELCSRQLRKGLPEDPAALEPVIERLVTGLLSASPR